MKKITLLFTILIAFALSCNAQWAPTNGPQGGYVSCFAQIGTNTFAGTYGGGVFVSSNSGSSWTAINNGLTHPWIGALAISGTNLFAGTHGGGVFLSTNNGANWTAVNTGLTNTEISSLAAIGSNIFAGTSSGVFLSTNNGTSWTAVNNGLTNTNITCLNVNNSNLYAGTGGSGVFLSTNNGSSWAPINTGMTTSYINSIASGGSNILAATWGAGVYRSQNDGASWTQVNSGLTNQDAMTIYKYNSDLYLGTKNGGAYYSNNNGSSWTHLNNGITSNVVRAIIANGANVFAGTSDGLFYSSSYGTSWTAVNNGLYNKLTQALYQNGTKLFAGTYGGMYASSDNGYSWNQSGLSYTSVQAITAIGVNLFAGTTEGVWRSNDNGNNWSQGNTVIRWEFTHALAVSGSDLFAGTNNGAYLSTDNGTSWTQVNNGLTNTFVGALAVSGSNIFAGTGNGVFLSTNNGSSWTSVSSGLTNTEIHALILNGTNLFAGTSDGVFLSTNNGTNWTQIKSGDYIASLAYHGTDLYAGGWQKLFLSKNNGTTWTQCNGGLSGKIYLVNALYSNGTDLFSGTQGDGVYKLIPTINDGDVWSQQNTQMPGSYIVANQVCVVDSNVVWLNGISLINPRNFAQAMSRTNDGGATWTSGNYSGLGSNVLPSVLSAVSYNIGFCCAYDTVTSAPYFYKTVDGGSNWTVVPGIFNNPSSSWPDGVKFWDHGKGFCYGDPVNNHFEIYYTSDSGVTWTQVADANNPLILSGEYGFTNPKFASIVSGGIGYFATNKGRIYKTTDYGVTWATTPTAPFAENIGIISASSANYILVSSHTYSTTLYTTNGGSTWDTVRPLGNFYNYDLCHVPNTNKMFVGTSPWSGWRGLNYSNDGGLSWSEFEDPTYVQPGSNTPFFGVGFYNTPLTAVASANATTICSGSPTQLNVTSAGGNTCGWVGNSTSPYTYNSILKIKHTPTYTYSWTSSPAGFASTLKNPTINPTANTTYFVTVSDGVNTTTSSILISILSPTVQATSFTVSAVTNSSMTVGWTRGSGDSVLVVAKQGSPVSTNPTGGTIYTPNVSYGSGSEIGSGNYVVYNGSGTSVNITNLMPGITYYFAVYEYTAGTTCYMIPPLTGSATTSGSYLCTSLNYLATKAQSIPGSYVDLGTNGNVIVTADFDDANSAAQNIGFPFEYNCQLFTHFVLNTNGFIKLGSTPPSTATLFFDGAQNADNGIFNSTNPADINLVAAFNHDLMAGTETPEYRVYTSGTAPNRVCTIQYKNVRDKTNPPAQQYDNMQFQIKLYETSNIIEFVFGDWTPSANASAFKTSACGLKGSSNADNELLVVNKGSATSWDGVTFTNANYSTTATLNFGNPIARPKPDAGRTFRFIPKYDNDLAVGEIYSMGDASLYYSNPQPVSVNIMNNGYYSTLATSVTLSVTGANTFTDTKPVPALLPGENTIVTFSDFTASANGSTLVTISLPNDDYNADNVKTWTQNTNDYTCNYSSSAIGTTGFGFHLTSDPTQSASGSFEVKYHVNGSANVNSVTAFIYNYSSNVGNTICGIVLNSSGSIIAQSDNYVIQAGDLGAWHTFTINTPPTITDDYFFAGMAVTVGATKYYPMGAQNENPSRSGTYYTSAIDGSGLTEEDPSSFPYRYMIGAILAPLPPVAGTAYNNSLICAGYTTSMYLAGYTGFIQWQQSPDGTSNWTNVTGGTGTTTANYTTAALATTTYFRAQVSEPTYSDVYSNVITVTVTPVPEIPAQTASVCSSGTFTVTPADNPPTTIVPVGTTYNWSVPTVTGGLIGGAAASGQASIFGTLTNPTNIPQTATYTVTPVGPTCTGADFLLTVTVNPKPVIANKSTTICGGASFTVSPVNGTDIVPSGTTYSWSAPTVTGGLTGGAVGNNQTSISGTLTNPTSTVQTATYTVTPTTSIPCSGASFTVTVTVNPTPVIPSLMGSICSGETYVLSVANTPPSIIIPSGTNYSWAAPSVTGGITGGISSFNQTSFSATLINPTNTPQTATYTITPATTVPCLGSSFTLTITVNPKPTIPAQTVSVCSGSTFTVSPSNNPPGTIVPLGTSYSWSAPTVSGGLTGGASGSGQTSISGTLINPTNIPQTATYTVTPTTSIPCPGNSFTIIVTVNPTPVVPSQTATICSGSTFTISPANAPPSTIIPSGTTYSWSAPTVTGGITGGTAGSGQTLISGTLTNPTNTVQTATYTVTPTTTIPCPGTSFTVTVTVNPTPVVPAQTSTICSGGTFTVAPTNNPPGTITPAGTTYSWSVPTVTGGITGGAAGSGQTLISGTLTNPTNTPQTATYTVTPTTSIPCPGTSFTVTVTVNPTPSVHAQSAIICSGGTFTVTPANNPPGTIVPLGITYSWSAPTVTGGLTGGAAGSGQSSISGTLINPTNIPQTATYTVTPTTSIPCPGASFTVTVTVNPTPVVPSQTATICSGSTFTISPANAPPSTIIPSGTTYSWSAPTVTGGITGGTAGSGQTLISGTLTNPTNTVQTATYTVTPTTTIPCPGTSFTVTVTVNPTPVVPAQTATICSGGTFTVTPANNPPGTIVPSGTAYSWSTPTVTGGITGGVSGSGQSSISGTLTNPTNTPQTATYTVTPTTSIPCPGNSFTVTVTVNPTPNVITASPTTICSGTATNIALNSNVSGASFSWTIGAITGGITGASASSGTTIEQTLTNPENTAGSVTYIVTPSANSCSGVATNIVVTVNPTPDVLTTSPTTICSGSATNIALNSNVSGTTFTWTIGAITGGINGASASGGSSITQTLTNPSSSTGSVTYIVTPSANSCPGVTTNIVVTVNPAPAISNMTTEVCNGAGFTISPVDITNGIVPAGTTYSWSVPTVTGGITGGVSGSGQSSISGTLTNPTNTPQTATYTVTPTTSIPCPGNSFTVTVTVNPTPNVLTASPTTICSGTATNIALSGNVSGTAFSWTIGTITGGITGASSSGGTAITQTLLNPGITDGSVTYIVTPTANTCTGSPTNIVVTVNPTPNVSTASSTVICSGATTNIALTSNFVGSTFSWTIGIITGSITGASASSGSTIAQVLNNPNATTGSVTYIVTPSASTCPGVPSNIVVTVDPTPVISAMFADVCSGSTFTVLPVNGVNGIVPSGITYSWSAPTVSGGLTGGAAGSGQSSISGTLINPTNIPQTATYTVTPTTSIPCPGASFTVTVTVNPTPVVPSQTATICSGSTFTISPANAPPSTIIPSGTTYSWSAPTVTGGITGGTAGSGQTLISGTLTNPTNTVQTATYTVTPTTTIPCPGTSFTVTVTVNPTPVVPAQTATICSGGTFTVTPTNNPPGTIVPSGTAYSWSTPTVTGGITGGVSGSGQSSISGTLTNPTNTPQTATFTVTPTTSIPCPGNSFTVTVTVNPTPNVLTASPTTICSGTATNIALNSNVSGASFSWTIGAITGGITGASALSGTTIEQTLTNPENTAGSVTYIVTPSANSCSGVATNIVVTVNPTPDVLTTSPTTICSGSATNIALNSNVLGTTFTWTIGAITGGITGASASGGSSITQTLTNPSSSTGSVTYIVTPSANSCPGVTTNIVVTVNPAPAISNMTTEVCNGAGFTISPVDITNGIVPAGTTYSWSVPTVTGGITGGVSGSGQSSISGTLTNPTNTPQTATYTVTPTTSIPCPGNSFTVTVTVNPTPNVITASPTTICSGTATNIALNSNVSGASFSWTIGAITGGITGASASSGTTIEQTLTNPENTAGSVTYIVTPSANSCSGVATNIVVTVNPTPDVLTTSPTTICSGSATNIALNSNVSGTTFTWTIGAITGGINGASASGGSSITQTLTNPSSSTGSVTYIVTPSANSCPGVTTNIVVTVNPAPAISNMTTEVCNGAGFTISPVDITNGIVPAGTTYSWSVPTVTGGITGGVSGSGQSSISGTLTNPTNTPQTATYTITPSTAVPCTGADFILTITVNPTPDVNTTSPTAICTGSPTDIALNSSVTGTTYNWTIGTISGGITGASASGGLAIAQTLTNSGTTAGTVEYIVTPSANGCSGIPTIILVTINPSYSYTENQSICNGDSYLWHGNNYTSTGEYNAIYASVSGCDSVYTLILTVNTVDIGVTLSNFGVTISADSAADAYQWVDCDNNFAPLATEINQSFTATANGNYAVIITQGSCSDTSACTEISSVGIAPFANSMMIDLYPNPVSDELTIEIKGNTIATNFEILNLIGQVVFKGMMLEKTTIQTTDFATGVYLIKIKNGKYFEYRKIVKQ